MWIPTPELAIGRIRDRVVEGGHNVPSEDVRRRFYRGIHNFFRLYRPLLNSWMLFDNSGPIPNLVAKELNNRLAIINEDLYNSITKTNLE